MKIKKILVSQPRPASDKSPYFDIAEKYGVEVVFRPMVKVEGLDAKEFRQYKVSLPDYTAIIFTARTAIDNFFRLCEEMRVTIPDTLKYFCTTEAIALYLQKYIVYRKRKIFFGKTGRIDDLIPSITKNSKEKFLIPVSDVHKKNESLLDQYNIDYTKAVMYRTVSNDFTEDENLDYDMYLLFSPAGVDALLKNIPTLKEKEAVIGCLGTSTAKVITDAGLNLDIQAPTPQAPSMTAALDLYLKSVSKAK